MEVQNLRNNYPKLIAYMEETGYCTGYINKIKCEIVRIISEAASSEWQSYSDVYSMYAERSSSPHYLRNKRTILSVIEQFDVWKQYPDGKQKVAKNGQYNVLLPEFKEVIDYYRAVERVRGKKETTIYCESHSATSFLFALQQNGTDALEKISEVTVLSIFMGIDGVSNRSYTYKKNIEAVFKACIPKSPETFGKILSYLPELRYMRKNIQYLKHDETTSVKQVLKGSESGLSLRDRAVGVLALYTGLRCCDIAGLRVCDIDWENEIIRIQQQKTAVPLELPLSVIVGNTIHDYLASERPETDCEYVFISKNRPYGRLKSGSLNNISKKIMKVADIRQRKGDRRGFHIFRHHLATELLGVGIPRPVISKILGHTTPNSLETYLSADFNHLKDCALSIEQFPMPKGVLGDA